MGTNHLRNRAFLERLRVIVEKNLTNEQFGVEDLAREAGMSRSQIHRRLQETTRQSTTQFIREIRLQRAMELLRTNAATVSEISYMVGFGSPSYFIKCFHDHYGYPPGSVAGDLPDETDSTLSAPDHVGLSVHRKSAAHRKIIYSTATLLVVSLLFGGYLYYQYNRNVAAPTVQSIAVLPLHNLTGDPGQEYFVDGLHDALIGELGQIRSLRVISRTSTLRFRNADSNLQEIARLLGVTNIIEGSVYQTGESIRIQVQLIKTEPDESHLWSQSYDRELREVLPLLSEVTRQIATEVHVTLTPEEETLLFGSRRSVNPEAYKAYLRGSYHLNKFTPEDYETGMRYLLDAVRIDPADPLPWARLALGYNTAGHGIAPPPEAFARAQAAAERALSLDETLGEVHLALALVDLYETWDWEAARLGFERTFRYDPNIAEAYANYSWFVMLSGGSVDEVIEAQRSAITLDPFMPLYPTYLGFIYWWAEKYDEAVKAAEQALELDPQFAYAYYVMGGALAANGRYEEAIRAHTNASEMNPEWRFALAHTYAMAGRSGEALKIANELADDPIPIETWGLAEIYTALGDTDNAFQWLDECYNVRFSWYPWIYWNPNFAPLKSDPRFDDHLTRIILPNRSSLTTAFR